MHAILFSSLYAGAYLALFWLYPVFFTGKPARLVRGSLFSVIGLLVAIYATIYITNHMQDEWLANRILHGFGGGFLMFTACYLIVKDTRLHIGRFQFFVFSVLIVTALGVCNELLELFLQYGLGLVYSHTTTDTWFDLLSNTIGIGIASMIFVPLLKKL